MFKFFKKLVSPFTKMRSLLGLKIREIFSGSIDESLFERLEQLLYETDLGSFTIHRLMEIARSQALKNSNPDFLLKEIEKEIMKVFSTPVVRLNALSPHVILFIGVNGSGKTTSLAKLAHHFRSNGKTVLFAASDTFRAAAVEQLEVWSHKIGATIIKSQTGADPSSVAFDAIRSAKAKGIDMVFIDTAGRLQNKTELMQELAKIKRTCQKQIPEAPHETLLVLDATVGQNALDQARAFHHVTPITGIILTKLDSSAKGGIAVAIQQELKIPILWVGLGEEADDLVPFNAKHYVQALLTQSS